MKTYPFLVIIIRLYWLALIILVGFLVYPVKDVLWKADELPLAATTEISPAGKIVVSPELTAEIKLGKTLFKDNCGTCHNRNMRSNMTGPALAGVRERWSDYPIEDLYSWIKNSTGLVEIGHPKAVEVFTTYKKMPMPAFNKLTDADAEAILTYVESVK